MQAQVAKDVRHIDEYKLKLQSNCAKCKPKRSRTLVTQMRIGRSYQELNGFLRTINCTVMIPEAKAWELFEIENVITSDLNPNGAQGSIPKGFSQQLKSRIYQLGGSRTWFHRLTFRPHLRGQKALEAHVHLVERNSRASWLRIVK